MGFACPVCDVPQPDAEHLANHLAFTAMLGREDHEAWLDDNAPGWDEGGPDDLAPVVADLAPEAEYDQVFEDTTGDGHAGHDHDHRQGGQRPALEDALADQSRYGRGGTLSGDDDVLSEARELTREMMEADEDEAERADDDRDEE